MARKFQYNHDNHWAEIEINIQRPNNGDQSLGFIISGGIDQPFLNQPGFTSILITNIIENTLPPMNEPVRMYDIILRVNNISFTNITHQEAIDVLRTAGQKVRLLVRRLVPPIIQVIKLEHEGTIGILITGGIGNEYCPGDHGIFIAEVDKHQMSKGLEVGDRLICISSATKTYDLRCVTHRMAINSIQSACAESRKIKLYVGRMKSISQLTNRIPTLPQGQHNPHESIPVNRGIKIEHYYENPTVVASPPRTKRRMIYKNDKPMILKFDHDDYQRYENRGRLAYNPLSHRQTSKSSDPLIQRAHDAKFSILPTEMNHDLYAVIKKPQINQPKSFTVKYYNENTISGKRSIPSLDLKGIPIHDRNSEIKRKLSERTRSDGDGDLIWQVD